MLSMVLLMRFILPGAVPIRSLRILLFLALVLLMQSSSLLLSRLLTVPAVVVFAFPGHPVSCVHLAEQVYPFLFPFPVPVGQRP
jgi:hypothetical protein